MRSTSLVAAAVSCWVLGATAGGAQTDAPAPLGGGVTVGVQTVEDRDESSKFQEYREIPNGFFVEALELDWSHALWSIDFSAFDLTQEDQSLGARLERSGTLRLDLRYDQTPRWFSNTARTLFEQEHGRYQFPLPLRELHEGFVASPAYPTLGDLVRASLADAREFRELRFRRDTAFAGLRWRPDERWRFESSVTHERRNGTQPFTVSRDFSDIVEFAAINDFVTNDVRASAELVRTRYHLGGEVAFSSFQNDVSGDSALGPLPNALVVENPLRATDALSGTNASAADYLVSRPPDNEAAWITLDGSLALTDWLRATALVSRGRHEQSERFLPFSLHGAAALQTTAIPDPGDPLSTIAVPVEIRQGSLYGPTVSGYFGGGRFDGEVDTETYDLRLAGRPRRWLDVDVVARGYDYDNRTPEYFVTDYVRADSGLEGISRAALPFAWSRDTQGVDVRVRPLRGLGLTAGYERETWDREFRNTNESTEHIVRLGADWSPASWLFLRAGYESGDREYEEYDEHTLFGEESYPEGEPVANAVVLEQRMFDLANRQHDRFDVIASVTPSERLTFGLSLTLIENDYDDRTEVEHDDVVETRDVLGRLEDRWQGWGIDVAWSATERITLYADYAEDSWEYDLASRYRPVTAGVAIDDPLNNWFGNVEDTTQTWGIGLDAVLVPERWTLDVRAFVADAEEQNRAEGVPGGAATGEPVDFPDVTNELLGLSADLRYRIGPNATFGFGYLLEDFEIDDFARNVMMPWMGAVDSGASEAVFLGYRIPEYDVNLLRVLFDYRF